MALVIGVKVLFTGEIDPDKEISNFLSPKHVTMFFLFEHLGEALPQFSLTIVFLVNNYPFLLVFDTLFGIPIPISLMSSIFSFGSLCMGVYSGCKVWCEDDDDDD